MDRRKVKNFTRMVRKMDYGLTGMKMDRRNMKKLIKMV